MPKGGREDEGREDRERGKEKKKREEDSSQPALGAAWFWAASEASAIWGGSNKLFGFSMERPKHWLHPCRAEAAADEQRVGGSCRWAAA